MIRVLVVDDHPAVRAGLVAMLRAEPGLMPVASAADPEAAMAAARRTRPDVAIVDYHLKVGDGLAVCRQLKSLPAVPRVLIYSAFAERGLGLPAVVAGADGLVDKGAPSAELFERVRTLARGEAVLAITPEAMTAGAAKLETNDLPILGLMMDRTPRAEIAEVLGLEARELERRIDAMLIRLTDPGDRNGLMPPGVKSRGSVRSGP
jgi:DNA-binding NarL/FixJ family response regulator